MFFASLLLVAAADPCAIPQPAPAQDPVAGSAYVEVGESELGHDSALVAFREALRLDPANARARRGFLLACTPKEARFDRARALMDEGDQRTAILLFEQVRADEGSSPSASLLEGICLYEVGEDARAKPLLQEALAQPAIADSARFFLGLIALREGNEEVARRELSRVSEASALRGDAQGLLGATQVAGKLSITVTADSGFDSNVTLAPSGVPGGGDGLGGVSATAVYRPLGLSGPFARAGGLYRAQFQLHDFDIGSVEAGLGWQVGRWARHLIGEYSYAYVAIGGAPYLSAHRLAAEGRWSFGTVALRANYGLRFENFQTIATSAFSGTLHTGDVRLIFGAIEVGYQVGRDLTAQPETTFFEHGPHALARVVLAPRWRGAFGAAALFRNYDAIDPALGNLQPRADVLVDLSGLLEYDVTDRWSGTLALGGRKAFSNVDSLTYLRITGAIGIAYSLGFW